MRITEKEKIIFKEKRLQYFIDFYVYFVIICCYYLFLFAQMFISGFIFHVWAEGNYKSTFFMLYFVTSICILFIIFISMIEIKRNFDNKTKKYDKELITWKIKNVSRK